MILRRITEHVKAQNWTAVALDFVIVVVGVFIGIQVSNWNAARTDRKIEAQYLARLHQELSEMSPQADAGFETAKTRHARIIQVKNYFESGKGGDMLDGEHCAAIMRSHIYAGVIFYPPTIKELISTGRIVLIRDNALRTAILSFDQANEEITQLRTDIQIGRLLLARHYPELVALGLSEWEESRCEFALMAANQAFLNDFTDNRHRYEAFANAVLGRQSEMIKSLGENVAASRGVVFAPTRDAAHDGSSDDNDRRAQ